MWTSVPNCSQASGASGLQYPASRLVAHGLTHDDRVPLVYCRLAVEALHERTAALHNSAVRTGEVHLCLVVRSTIRLRPWFVLGQPIPGRRWLDVVVPAVGSNSRAFFVRFFATVCARLRSTGSTCVSERQSPHDRASPSPPADRASRPARRSHVVPPGGLSETRQCENDRDAVHRQVLGTPRLHRSRVPACATRTRRRSSRRARARPSSPYEVRQVTLEEPLQRRRWQEEGLRWRPGPVLLLLRHALRRSSKRAFVDPPLFARTQVTMRAPCSRCDAPAILHSLQHLHEGALRAHIPTTQSPRLRSLEYCRRLRT